MTKEKNPIEFQNLKPYEQMVVKSMERIAYALENIEATLVWRYGECPPKKTEKLEVITVMTPPFGEADVHAGLVHETLEEPTT